MRHQHDTLGFVERSFECGEFGHIIRNYSYLHKLKAKVDVPREQNYQKRPVSSKQDPRLMKERGRNINASKLR
ncbi:hypothetical protein Hanom_Chr02g00112511 [Helianthus anomalus]